MAPQVLTLPDSRKMEYLVSGAGDGFPFVFIHGTPGACVPNPAMGDACSKKGIQLITPSRAGYGGSTRQRGRVVVDFTADVQALLDHLGIKKCVVGGWSGGGPHAIACAARLPSCAAALVVAGVGPSDADDLDFLAGQGQSNIEEFEATAKGEDVLQQFCGPERVMMLQADAKGLTEGMSSILPDIDKRAMVENDIMGQYLVDMFHEALKNGVDGWVDDDLAFMRPWGFELSEVKVPVHIYQGSEDIMVPFSHGKWIVSHLPPDKVRAHLLDGEGHVSIYLGRMDEMLDGLLAEVQL